MNALTPANSNRAPQPLPALSRVQQDQRERATAPQFNVDHPTYRDRTPRQREAIRELGRLMSACQTLADAADTLAAEIRDEDSTDATDRAERFLDEAWGPIDDTILALIARRLLP